MFPLEQEITGSARLSGHSSVNSFDNEEQPRKDKGKGKGKGKDKDKAAKGKGKEEDEASVCSLTIPTNQSSSNNASVTPPCAEAQHRPCRIAFLGGNMVSFRPIRKRTIKLDRRILEDMQEVGWIDR